MHILRSAVYFPVLDVRAIGVYYRDVLGFACEYSAGDPPEFALYKRGEASIMFRRVASSERSCPNEAQGGAWDVFLWVDDAEAFYAELREKAAEVVYPPTLQPYGMKEFAVRDPNGYILGFGEAMDQPSPQGS